MGHVDRENAEHMPITHLTTWNMCALLKIHVCVFVALFSSCATQNQDLGHIGTLQFYETFFAANRSNERLNGRANRNFSGNALSSNAHRRLQHRFLLRNQTAARRLRNPNKQEDAIRLVGGLDQSEGNVEVLHLGKWGMVCDDEWDFREGDVVCRQLGFSKAEGITVSSHFGRGAEKVWMDDVYCLGDEEALRACRFAGWGLHDCSRDEAAGVRCSRSLPGKLPKEEILPPQVLRARIQDLASDFDVRLRGGRIPLEGRVEVLLGEAGWGVICGDGWDVFAAQAVCKHLKLGYALAAFQADVFGGGTLPMLLSNVSCSEEEPFGECYSELFGKTGCPGEEGNIAGVACAEDLPDLMIDHHELTRTLHLEDRQLFFLQCAMEENCLAPSAFELRKKNSFGWHLEVRRLLRFTAKIVNVGTADFLPFLAKESWQWHQCHLHYHSMELFARFDVLNLEGKRVAEGHKASFCLEDNQCLNGTRPKYACANYGDQGISPGCVDTYAWNIDCQWIDLTDVPAGTYVIKISINPEFKIAEMDYRNNAAMCTLIYTQTHAYVSNCSLTRP